MTITAGYSDIADMESMMGVTLGSASAVEWMERSIEAASRRIDSYTGRTFGADTDPSDRFFQPLCVNGVYDLADIADTTTAVVYGGYADTGIYSTVAASGYTWIPADGVGPNGATGWPARGLRPVYAWAWPALKVNAKWGWPAVPDDVKVACRLLAMSVYQAKDMRGGLLAVGDLGLTRAAMPRMVADTLAPYRLAATSGLGGVA